MSGAIIKISGPTVTARGMEQSRMFNRVAVGTMGLMGEVIRLTGNEATIQVYEDTTGLTLGEQVTDVGEPLLAELGPGLLGSVFDGVQRPLDKIAVRHGDWIARGVSLPALSRERAWAFTPVARNGMSVRGGDCLGLVPETEKIRHRILVPPGVSGIVRDIHEGTFTVTEPIAGLDNGRRLTMMQRWPVRTPRPVAERLAPAVPFVTGQRALDMLFPIAAGGTVIVPGGFGTGKCMPGEVPVLMADGTLRTLVELYETYSANGAIEQRGEETLVHINPGFKVISYDGRSLMPKVCTALYRGVSDLLYYIRTRSGREYRVTSPHPLLTVSPELTLRFVPAQSLREGDYLAVPRQLTLSTEPQKLGYDSMLDQARVSDDHVLKEFPKLLVKLLETRRCSLKALAREMGVNYVTFRGYVKGRNLPPVGIVKRLYRLAERPFTLRQVKGEHNSHSLRLPELVDGDLAEFLALVLADGGMKPSGVEFYNNDEDLLDRFDAIAWRLFGLRGKRGTANTVRCSRLCSILLVRILVRWGVPASGKAKAGTCRIPEIIMRSPHEVSARFLGDYFLCDGYFGNREIEFSTAGREMQSGLSYLLTRLGILHQWREKRVKGKRYYRLSIRGKAEVKRFYETCSGALARFPKFAAMASYLGEKKRGDAATDIVPPFPRLFRAVYDHLGRPHAEMEKLGVHVSNYIGGRLRMTAETFQLYAEFAKEPRLTAFAGALKHLYCDPIVAIERVPGPHVVYDLTVPQVHNFVGGEMPALLHNTVVEQTLAKHARADIIVYIGCGERGNEMTDVLAEFPHLKDPATGLPLMQRTVMVINTSNMPVAARETSIYTGITIAEYYRDMGYAVALMADSTSRWAEAAREISARLEEMPGEEGYPTYLAAKLAGFYERGGRVRCLGEADRQGSVTIVSAISPPGGDFSEPVTQSSMQVAGALWALDSDLAHRRHFPAVSWKRSFSLYAGSLDAWFRTQVAPDWPQLRTDLAALLQKEEELQEIVQLVGIDALQDQERIVLEASRLIREEYLRQNAYSETDAACPLEKQYWMLKSLLQFLGYCRELLKRGRPIEQLLVSPFRTELERLKETPPAGCIQQAQAMIEKMQQELRT